MRRYRMLSLVMIMVLSGCVMFTSRATKSGVEESPLMDNQTATVQEYLTGARKLQEEGQFPEAIAILQKVLTQDPENQTAISMIQESKKILQILQEQQHSYKNSLKKIRKKNSERLSLFRNEYQRLETALSQEKEKKENLDKTLAFSKALYEAGIALADHDFEKAKKFTRKAMMIFPDSKEASAMWVKVAKSEEEWRMIEKIKEAKQAQSKKDRFISRTKQPVKSERVAAGNGKTEKSSSRRRGKGDAVSQSGKGKKDHFEDRIQKQSQGDMETILRRQMIFANLPLALEQPVKADFLEEQSLIVFRKLISEYEKEMKEGSILSFNEKEFRDYREGVAEAYFSIGKYYELKKNPEDALQYFSGITSQFSNSKFFPAACYHSGLIYLTKKEPKKAYEAFEKVIDFPSLPQNENAGRNGLILPFDEMQLESYKEMAQIHRDEKNYQSALKLYRGLREKSHQDSSVIDEMDLLIADTQMEMGKPEIAYDLYASLIKKGVKCRQYEKARFNRTLALIRLNRFTEARVELEDIMNGDRLNAYKMDAAYRYGQTYYAEGNHSKAIVLLQKALNESPDYKNKVQYLIYLADAYAQSALADSALSVYQQIIDKYEDSSVVPQALYESAKLLYGQCRYKESKDKLSALNKMAPDSVYAKEGGYLLGDIYLAQEKYDSAEKQYHAAYLENPEGFSAFMSNYKRIQCFKKMGKNTLLLKYFSDLIPNNDMKKPLIMSLPEKERSLYLKYFYKIIFEYGDLLMQLKKYSEAIVYFTRVAEEYPLGEDSSWSRYLIGKCYELNGEKEKAIVQYQSIVEKGGEGFWVDQARFDSNNLAWSRQFQKQAISVGGKYAEGTGN
ncbi:MAG: tetratricopeptide repeat protein [Candidatus Aureabacteria bacterium]|nr:tetratricopeptide repeat protein [Candidatus Auribacterota bacterium]